MLAGSQLVAQQTNLDKQSSSQKTSSDSTSSTTSSSAVSSDQTPEAVAGDMMGVENGLWEGCEPGNCCAVCGGGYCTPPSWYTEQGARILTRSRPRRNAITYQFVLEPILNQTTGELVNQLPVYAEEMNVHDANFDIAPGYNATIGCYLGRDSMDRDDFLEFTYWGMNTWQGSAIWDPALGQSHQIPFPYTSGVEFFTGVLYTPFYVNNKGSLDPTNTGSLGVLGFDNAGKHGFIMDSEMHNWELNLRLEPRGRPDQLVLHPNGRWRRECQPGTYMSYLVGLRYMTIGDGFHFHSTGMVTIQNSTIDGTYLTSGDYNILTQNDLFGFQIGTELQFRRCKWNWGLRAKVGPYVNFARNVKDINNDLGGLPDVLSAAVFNNDRFTAQRQKVALIGEVGFEASYKFKPNLKGRAAYDFMWISGLALGGDQLTWELDPPANATINTNGSIYSHGITLSLEWCW